MCSRLISSGQIIGQSQLQFLREVGRPELALGFIKDPASRCLLALESNHLEAAFAAAGEVNDEETWLRVGQLSLLNGDLKVAEQSYQRGRLYERLMFLYLITGQRDKLDKLGRIFRVRGETSSLLQVGLITRAGDIVADTLALAGYTRSEIIFIITSILNICNIKPGTAGQRKYRTK